MIVTQNFLIVLIRCLLLKAWKSFTRASRAQNANAYAELWVRSVREECLDHLLILNERHLGHVLSEYSQYYNHARPHQGLKQQVPGSANRDPGHGAVRKREVLGGLIYDYYRETA